METPKEKPDKKCSRCNEIIMEPELTLAHGWLEFYGGCECPPMEKEQLPLFPGESPLTLTD